MHIKLIDKQNIYTRNMLRVKYWHVSFAVWVAQSCFMANAIYPSHALCTSSSSDFVRNALFYLLLYSDICVYMYWHSTVFRGPLIIGWATRKYTDRSISLQAMNLKVELQVGHHTFWCLFLCIFILIICERVVIALQCSKHIRWLLIDRCFLLRMLQPHHLPMPSRSGTILGYDSLVSFSVVLRSLNPNILACRPSAHEALSVVCNRWHLWECSDSRRWNNWRT